MKTCNRCQESKPLDRFTKNGARLYSICKGCRKTTSEAYRARPKADKLPEEFAAYRASNGLSG